MITPTPYEVRTPREPCRSVPMSAPNRDTEAQKEAAAQKRTNIIACRSKRGEKVEKRQAPEANRKPTEARRKPTEAHRHDVAKPQR